MEKCWEILQAYLNDQRQSWIMKTDGTYEQLKSDGVGIHELMIQVARAKMRAAEELNS